MKSGSRASSSVWKIDAMGLLACGVLTCAAYLAGAQPLVERNAQATDRAEQLNQERQRHQELVASNRDLKARLTNAQEALAKADVSLQPARAVNQRIAALTSLANDVGLEVQSINTSAIVPGLRYSQLPIRLDSTAGYRTSAAFLHKLRQTFKDMSVTGFELTDNPTDLKGASFNVQLIWYVQPTGSTSK